MLYTILVARGNSNLLRTDRNVVAAEAGEVKQVHDIGAGDLYEQVSIGREKAIEIRPAQSDRKSYGISITKDRIDIINHQQNTNGYVTLSDLRQGTEVAVGLPLIIT